VERCEKATTQARADHLNKHDCLEEVISAKLCVEKVALDHPVCVNTNPLGGVARNDSHRPISRLTHVGETHTRNKMLEKLEFKVSKTLSLFAELE
jgi:hypothetical protein